MDYRTNYGEHDSPGVDCGATMTEQSHMPDCDINTILDRYAETGQLVGMIKNNPLYGDFSDATDYTQAMDLVIRANDQFAHLDAKVRNRFGNDPASFLEFCNDPNNGEELVKMGLATVRPKRETGVAEGGTSSPAVGEGPKA